MSTNGTMLLPLLAASMLVMFVFRGAPAEVAEAGAPNRRRGRRARTRGAARATTRR